MRAFVTGITGFVGGHLAEHLIAAGDIVAGISTSGRWPRRLEHLARQARLDAADLVVADLVETLRRKRPEAVYHLAARANPRRSLDDPHGAWVVNLVGTLNLLEAVRASGLNPRVLLVGSAACYGRPAADSAPIAETCPFRPETPYAASKAAADLLGLQHHLTYGAEIVRVHPFHHTGPRQSPDYVLSDFARRIVEIEHGRCDHLDVGNLEIVRDFSDVRDVVAAYRLLIQHGCVGESYNLGGGVGTSLAVAVEMLRSEARVSITVRVDPARLRAGEPSRLVADARKLRAATGWEPRRPLESTLADLLDDWRRFDLNSQL